MKRKLKNTFVPHEGNNHTPHILSRKGVKLAIGFLVAVQLLVYAWVAIIPSISSQLAAIFPSTVTLLTNQWRSVNNIPDLKTNETLTRAAQAKAEDMASKSYFAHQSPDGSQPWDWISRAGYQYAYAGENLAVNFTDSGYVVEAWKNSPTHNMNLIGPRYTETGVGVATGIYKGREAIFVVQMFASPLQLVPSIPAPVRTEPAQAPRVEEPRPVTLGVLGANIEMPVVEAATKLASSPRTYSTHMYYFLGALFALVLLLGLTPIFGGKHHPQALRNGLFVIGIIFILVLLNDKVLYNKLELPMGGENAVSVDF
jgi:hypothetical protein